ncbi:hypothetical protein CLF_104691 [Clonorchis sinensis]|uniref:Uncharacterized protein n=1 Tax=Clonorchis sinensis TaxID=79923 RepID=G7YC49_CLOSI|nr:hypothetical protein CLF_104691 [Clonorchis sinensis]
MKRLEEEVDFNRFVMHRTKHLFAWYSNDGRAASTLEDPEKRLQLSDTNQLAAKLPHHRVQPFILHRRVLVPSKDVHKTDDNGRCQYSVVAILRSAGGRTTWCCMNYFWSADLAQVANEQRLVYNWTAYKATGPTGAQFTSRDPAPTGSKNNKWSHEWLRALLKYGTPSCEVRQFAADKFGKILTFQDIHNYRWNCRPALLNLNTNITSEYEVKGYVNRAPTDHPEGRRYVPYHPVLILHKPKGEDLTNGITGVRLRLRLNDIALSADIEEMFLSNGHIAYSSCHTTTALDATTTVKRFIKECMGRKCLIERNCNGYYIWIGWVRQDGSAQDSRWYNIQRYTEGQLRRVITVNIGYHGCEIYSGFDPEQTTAADGTDISSSLWQCHNARARNTSGPPFGQDSTSCSHLPLSAPILPDIVTPGPMKNSINTSHNKVPFHNNSSGGGYRPPICSRHRNECLFDNLAA